MSKLKINNKEQTEYITRLLEHVHLNCRDYPKCKSFQSFGYLLFLFKELTKQNLSIPEQLQKYIAEGIDKGWIKNNYPKPKGRLAKPIDQIGICEKLFKQMCDDKLIKKEKLDTRNKHVEYLAKKLHKTPTSIYKTLDTYGDMFVVMQSDWFKTFDTKQNTSNTYYMSPSKKHKDILENQLLSRETREWGVSKDYMKRNPNSIKNKRKKP